MTDVTFVAQFYRVKFRLQLQCLNNSIYSFEMIEKQFFRNILLVFDSLNFHNNLYEFFEFKVFENVFESVDSSQ